MTLKNLIVSATVAITLTVAGAVAAESHAEKAAAAAKADEATSAAKAYEKEAGTLQGQADKMARDAASARAKAAANPTAANTHEAKLKAEESVDAAAAAGDMEGKAAVKEKAAESGK